MKFFSQRGWRTDEVFFEKTFKDWEEFINDLKIIHGFRESEHKLAPPSTYKSPFLYRGQANKDWDLQTTLERFTGQNKFEIINYYSSLLETLYKVEAFTKNKWNLPCPTQYAEKLKKLRPLVPIKDLFPDESDLLPYFVYLRHHGFPSPLLDWTHSPYIAAHFAFNEAKSSVQFVSIFIFLEQITGLSGRGGLPTINTIGPNVRTHERHFLQQCGYTYCIEEKESEKFFSSHIEAFTLKLRKDQQYLWKCNIPITEKEKVLEYLNSVNINSFSLFQSLEGLMNALATREFFLNK